MACCGGSGPNSRPASTTIVFVVVGPGGDVQEWTTFHEASVQRADLGGEEAGFKVETRRKVLQQSGA